MKKKLKILILGKGRMGMAFFGILRRKNFTVEFWENRGQLKSSDLFIGALPSSAATVPLKFALLFKKDLLDISDLESSAYLKLKAEIKNRGVRVIAHAGFCPGILDFLIGYETKDHIEEIICKAGTLSPKRFFFPFLWCFEDLLLEHSLPSIQIVKKRKRKFPPFSYYLKEKIFGIDAETYLAPSGFEYILDMVRPKRFEFRVIRPIGFYHFFQFLTQYSFFTSPHISFSKKILEGSCFDNLTVGLLYIKMQKKRIIWEVKSFSKRQEKLNSMQKATIVFPIELLNFFDRFESGLYFPADIARGSFAHHILERLKKSPFISIKRKCKS